MLDMEINYNLENLKEWMKEEPRDTPMLVGPGSSSIIREPLGIVGCIGSWNFPLVTGLSGFISAMAAGNCVLFKPSEMTPFTSMICKRLFARYLDTSAYSCVVGQIEVAKRITSSKGVNLIIFTGSGQTGRLVAASAAQNLTPCILELGGKCPAIVDSSADIEFAAMKIAFFSYLNSG